MKTDCFGQISISEDEAVEALYRGAPINNIVLDDNQLIAKFNQSIDQNKDKVDYLKALEVFDIDVAEFDKLNQRNWFMPEESKQFPLVHFLYSKCTDDEQVWRVDKELNLFIKHNMLDLLYYLKYLVDAMRSNNILWGVGRGSSVSSYVLYLLGVHKIDSIKYKLDINEFLK